MAEQGAENQGQSIRYGIRGISLEDFTLDEENPAGDNKMTFTIRIRLSFNPEEQQLIMIPEGKFMDKENQSDLVRAAVKTIFEVQGLADYVSEKDGEKQLNLPDEFMFSMANMALDHTRAILSYKLQDTKFENLLMPVIDPADILKRQSEGNGEEQ